MCHRLGKYLCFYFMTLFILICLFIYLFKFIVHSLTNIKGLKKLASGVYHHLRGSFVIIIIIISIIIGFSAAAAAACVCV